MHPSGVPEEAILHPELNVGVEWRFVYFRAANAEDVVNAMTAILWDLVNQGKPANNQIADYAKGLRVRLGEVAPQLFWIELVVSHVW